MLLGALGWMRLLRLTVPLRWLGRVRVLCAKRRCRGVRVCFAARGDTSTERAACGLTLHTAHRTTTIKEKEKEEKTSFKEHNSRTEHRTQHRRTAACHRERSRSAANRRRSSCKRSARERRRPRTDRRSSQLKEELRSRSSHSPFFPLPLLPCPPRRPVQLLAREGRGMADVGSTGQPGVEISAPSSRRRKSPSSRRERRRVASPSKDHQRCVQRPSPVRGKREANRDRGRDRDRTWVCGCESVLTDVPQNKSCALQTL